MSTPFDFPPYAHPSGQSLRASWTNSDSGTVATQLALTEAAGVGGSLYSGTSNVSGAADSLLRPYLVDLRSVTAQTSVAFTNGTPVAAGEAGYLKLGFWTPTLLVDQAVSAVSGTGDPSGTVAVDHATLDINGDTLLIERMGEGVGGAIIRAYLKSEWDADSDTAVLRDQTTSNDDGRWVEPMFLSSGLTYYIRVNVPNVDRVLTKTVTVA